MCPLVRARSPCCVASPSVGDLHAQLVKRGVVAPLLSVVVPVKNEEQGILPFVERVGAILEEVAAGEGWEILFVDDGSTDATLAAIVAANQRDAACPRPLALAQFRQGSRAQRRARSCPRRRGDPDGRRHAGPARGAAGDGRQVARGL